MLVNKSAGLSVRSCTGVAINSAFLPSETTPSCANNKPGTLGTVLLAGDCSTFSCGSCALGQTCDVVFGLCQGAALFVGPNLTLPTTTAAAGGTEEWVIAVSVVVPAVVLLSVAVAVLVIYRRKQKMARYDRDINLQLQQSQIAALRTNADL